MNAKKQDVEPNKESSGTSEFQVTVFTNRIKNLTEHFDVYILSTAPWNNPSAWSDILLWVQKHLGDIAYKRLILSSNKNLNAGDYLIDDRTANGASDFKGEHIHF